MVDSFFVDPSKKRRKNRERDNRKTSTVRGNLKKQKHTVESNTASKKDEQIGESDDSIDDIASDEVDSDVFADVGDEGEEAEDVKESDDEEDYKNESEADKRRRLAKEYLADLKRSLGQSVDDEDGEGGEDGGYNFDAKDLDDEIISSRLKKDVAEQKGWVYKFYGNRLGEVLKEKKTRVPSKCLTSVCVSYPYLFTTSKDMEISKWDIRDPLKNPQLIKTIKGGPEFEEINKEHSENGHCDEIYTSAVSPDGKYLVTGGKDGRIIVWSVNNLSCIRVLETRNRKGEVLSLTFRRNSDQLYAACADLKIRTYSINQLAQLEILYGHQDLVVDISALALERCVTVGSRDRTAMLWKIADETRLTFRGGDSIEKYRDVNEKVYFEGSIDCVSMIDDSHFVSGSDNGSIALWSLNKKKPLFTNRISHGLQPELKLVDASAEKDIEKAKLQVPEQQPFGITTICAVPYSDIFISGSWNGEVIIWKLDEELRRFEKLKTLKVNGIVNKICTIDDEENGQLRIYASISKEFKFSRTIKALSGSRNIIFTCVIKV
ncbi:hypothetical protein CANINC_005041 [Pichia inconspicua]|uniref:Uncharacterized protein n=1 Tax=Pichia inconspicua TaxID=52247 RepID=A0A4T0WUI7_9ASCO|nr:hypothetical protein CANINC_005041 [[Candida] inconspicua]